MSPHVPTHRGAALALLFVLGLVAFSPAALAQDQPPPPPPATKAPPGYPPSYPPGYRPGYPPGYPPVGKAPTTRPPRTGTGTGTDSAAGEERGSTGTERRTPGTPPRPGTDREAGDDQAEPGQMSEFETGIDFRRPSGLVSFNFEDADLPDLVRTITAITGRRFIIGGKVRSIKATVYAPTKVRPAEAYRAFLSALEVNGLTVVPSGRYLKIIESSGSTSAPLPVYRDGEVVPTEERMVTRLHRLGHVGAEDLVEVLGRFKSRDGDVTVYAPTNTLILTDTGSNVRRMLQLVEELDVAASGEQIWVEPIHHASASEIAEKLLEIFEAAGGGAPSKRTSSARRPPTKAGGTTGAPASSGPSLVGTGQSESRLSKIIPDDRTNSLIIVATERAYLRILELIRLLDVPLAGEGEIHVEYLQNADAEELAGVIQSIVGGGRGAGASARRRQGGSAGSSTASSAPAGGASAEDVFEGNVQVVADKATNSLVILSSLRDYTSLRSVIQRLDIPRRQVFVEAALMEVSQSRLNTLGLAFHGGLPVDVNVDGTTGDPAIGFTGTAYPAGTLPFSSVAIDPTALTGLAAGLLGPEIEGSEQVLGFSLPAFGIVLQALQTDNDVNVISTPHILATDNVEAQITVGQNVPVQQGFAGLAQAAGQAGAGNNLAGLAGLLPQVNVQRQNVGLTLKLTPHVNESQQVRLELSVELSEVQGAGSINPTISQRTANTQVVVRDQQTIVIGGLVRDIEAQTENKVPILGDIPILGYLFRRTESRREKQNLLIILTPYIIRDASDLRAIFQRKLEERREFIERYTAFANRDPDIHVDYARTNGLLEEINQAYNEAMLEDRLLRDAAARIPPEHVAGQPIEMPRGGMSSGGQGGEGEDGGGEDAPEPGGESTPEQPPPPTVGGGGESGE